MASRTSVASRPLAAWLLATSLTASLFAASQPAQAVELAGLDGSNGFVINGAASGDNLGASVNGAIVECERGGRLGLWRIARWLV